MKITCVFMCAMGLVMGCSDAEPEKAEQNGPKTKAEAAEAVHTGKADFSFDFCESAGWYDDGSCDWFCPHTDNDCDLPTLFEGSKGQSTKYPIILAHGFNASPTFFSFTGVSEALQADGHVVFTSTVPPYQSAEVRAGFLAREVDRVLNETGAERVNIIAHSMGGLDARVLISDRGYGDVVASLTTISTPHRGSRVADVALGLLEGVADDALEAFAEFLGEQFSELSEDADLRAAFLALTESGSAAFNSKNTDDAQVYYQSWAGVSSVLGIANPLDDIACEGKFIRNSGTNDKMSLLLVKAAAFVAHGIELLPNDGMVTVTSAKWGDFRGCIPADHADEVGAFSPKGADPHTGFDHIVFYQHVAFDLAAKGY